MTATETRLAAPGLTPVSSVLGHEERISSLEAQIKVLGDLVTRQTACIDILNHSNVRAHNALRVATAIDIAHNDRLMQLESVQRGDRRLSDVLSGIEARLATVELADERLTP